jgi:hypothetical protein
MMGLVELTVFLNWTNYLYGKINLWPPGLKPFNKKTDDLPFAETTRALIHLLSKLLDCSSH